MAPRYETQTVVGVFRDYETAREAVRELINQGIPESAIDIQGDGARTDYQRREPSEGGISGWFRRTFGDDRDEEARHYRDAVSTGRTVVSVAASGPQIDTAAEILNRYGAVQRDGEYAQPATGNQTAAIPVVEEQLQLGKRVVTRGGVRIYSRVVDQPVSEQIKLREEHVRVERRPVDRDLSPEEMTRLRDQTIEVTTTREEPVVSKRARVREEVVVGKETTERTETVKDNVRRTEVRVEKLDGSDEPVADNGETPWNRPRPSR
jgi:uncharacterized protein (TIGR02271 family)